MTDIAIRVQNLSKCHHIYDAPRDRLKQFVVPALQRLVRQAPRQYFHEFWALKDVSFEIKKGDAFGIIGRNGSGKSTLLQMICGTLNPTGGSIQTNGRIAALLELGSGFNPDFTGRENIYLNGAILGLTGKEIDARLDDILGFADIGDFIDQPVKTYSSGMFVRLAFAIQVNVDPEILIVDEALSVGDFFFQQKCFARLRKMRENGLTLLFVSHDMGTVRDLCPKSIYLIKGKAAFMGDSQEAIRRYLSKDVTSVQADATFSSEQNILATADMSKILRNALWRNESQALDTEGKLLAVAVCDKNGAANAAFRIGDVTVITVAYVSKLSSECHAGINILNKFGQIITVAGSYTSQVSLPKDDSGSDEFKIVVCELRVTMLLEAGQYSLEACCGPATLPNRGELLAQSPPLGPVTITWDYENEIAPFLGQFGLPVECRCYL
ncbi:MAG: ABC transporter ATP-binding protein [Methylobacter sp.]|uniref:ABC transporter ATP-binding protein n=1 Tax=Methylobacter sp. TaxID=2051955 RepID=UPI0025E69995|nr:ABC transporter ATP-binding protein [Methylobacter sp.]MCK9622339.1 ABC transporter ATP-binding protein [Methylobacter sp.]